MLQQNQLYRDNALGNFRTLALAVSRNPAMLVYLNGNQNYKEHPNENYARELMEIFTCGIGNYTEDDVKASARAFSGWNLQRGKFVFNPRQHDDGLKTFMGRTGNLNGDDIVDILVAHPSTATRLCEQLFTYFAYPDPKPEIIAALTQTYYKSGYDIKAVVGQILRSQAFYEAKAQNAIIKCPVQFVIGTAKMLGLTEYFKLKPEDITPQNDDARAFRSTSLTRPNGNKTGGLAALVIAMRNMGQDILAPPNVKGWDGGEDWINSTTLLARSSFANAIAQNAMVTAMLNDDILTSELSSASDLIDQFAIRMGPLPLSSATRAALVDYYLNSYKEFTGDSRIQFGRKSRVRQVNRVKGLLALIMATPEYQVC